MNKSIYLIFAGILIFRIGYSQSLNLKEVQTGVSLRTTVDINGWENRFKYSNFNVALVGGIGFHPFEASFVYPSMHAGIMIYNRGDLGSSYDAGFFKSTQLELLGDITLHGGIWRNNVNHIERAVPLYHFSDILPSPLLNPFQHSLSFGSNFIFSFDKYKEYTIQQVGFINILIDRHFQFNTFNDGSFFKKLYLGDGYDRYYTGGGQFSYHINATNSFDRIELSFLKYTGFDYATFETANLLQLDFIEFKNKKSVFYNKNRMRLRLSNTADDYTLHITAHNTDSDFQDWIHYNGDYTYFTDIFENSKSLWNELRRLGFGGSYNYTNR